MSALGLKWAYTQKVGNAVAKNILAFLASHNFTGDQSCFKIRTIMAATEYEERVVRGALALLAEKGLILKKARFGEKGQQLSNEYSLNIPTSYKEDFYSSYGTQESPTPVDKSGGGVHHMQGGGASHAGGGVHEVHPYNNKLLNNNINKSSCDKSGQKKLKETASVKTNPPAKLKSSYQNEKKHEFAESMEQMANEERHIKEHEARKALEKKPHSPEMQAAVRQVARRRYVQKVTDSDFQH